jgi:hypothetical protein
MATEAAGRASNGAGSASHDRYMQDLRAADRDTGRALGITSERARPLPPAAPGRARERAYVPERSAQPHRARERPHRGGASHRDGRPRRSAERRRSHPPHRGAPPGATHTATPAARRGAAPAGARRRWRGRSDLAAHRAPSFAAIARDQRRADAGAHRGGPGTHREAQRDPCGAGAISHPGAERSSEESGIRRPAPPCAPAATHHVAPAHHRRPRLDHHTDAVRHRSAWAAVADAGHHGRGSLEPTTDESPLRGTGVLTCGRRGEPSRDGTRCRPGHAWRSPSLSKRQGPPRWALRPGSQNRRSACPAPGRRPQRRPCRRAA